LNSVFYYLLDPLPRGISGIPREVAVLTSYGKES
jgi:hypothetical protein